jgi:hypothetical protein
MKTANTTRKYAKACKANIQERAQKNAYDLLAPVDNVVWAAAQQGKTNALYMLPKEVTPEIRVEMVKILTGYGYEIVPKHLTTSEGPCYEEPNALKIKFNGTWWQRLWNLS